MKEIGLSCLCIGITTRHFDPRENIHVGTTKFRNSLQGQRLKFIAKLASAGGAMI
jgi:hypothetical protein